MEESEKEKDSASDRKAKFGKTLSSAAELFCNSKSNRSNLLQLRGAFAEKALLLDEVVCLSANITKCDRFRKLVEVCELLGIQKIAKCSILAKVSEGLGYAHALEQQQQRKKNVSVLLQRNIEHGELVFTGLNQVDGSELSQWLCIEGYFANVAGLSDHKLGAPVMAKDDRKHVSSVLKQVVTEKQKVKGEVARLKMELVYVSGVLKEYEDFPADHGEAKAVVESLRKHLMEIKSGVLSSRF